MDIKIQKIVDTARQLKAAEHEAGEGIKKGCYRAGSTGLFIDGTLYGKCARKLLLRSKGISVEEISPDRQIMFSGGLMNEEILLQELKLGSDYLIKTEEEIPTEWFTDTLATRVTGRPDIVLCDFKTHDPLLGLELKMASSLWTARDVAVKGLPKFDHLTQAAHYMWQLKIPFKIVYTSYVDYAAPTWASVPSHFPAPGDPGSEFLEYDTEMSLDGTLGLKLDRKGSPKVKKVKPFRVIYDLKWSPTGTLLYKREEAEIFERTIITIKGIQEYFELLDRAQEQQQLPPRPENVDPNGKKSGWSLCDPKYCSLALICDKKTKLDSWLEEVQKKTVTTN